VYRLGDRLADVVDALESLGVGFGDRAEIREAAELAGELSGRRRPDARDTQRRDEVGKRRVATGLDLAQEVFGAGLAPPLERQQVLALEFVEVRDGLEQAGVDELADALLADPLEVKAVVAGVVLDRTPELGVTAESTGTKAIGPSRSTGLSQTGHVSGIS